MVLDLGINLCSVPGAPKQGATTNRYLRGVVDKNAFSIPLQ